MWTKLAFVLGNIIILFETDIKIMYFGFLQLDDWVLCRIYKKRHVTRTEEIKSEESPSPQQNQLLTIGSGANDQMTSHDHHHQQQTMKFPRTHSLSYLLDLDYLGPIAHLLNDNTSGYDAAAMQFQTNMGNQAGFDPSIGPYLSHPSAGLNCQQMYGAPSNYK
uniref:NAC domain-containing protein n=1 Tax=Opuntia streptacantha TaxID=393608 RepID=A0A7C8YUR6_OPUST